MFTKHWDVRLKSHHQSIRPLRAFNAGEQTLAQHLAEAPAPAKERCIYIHVPFCSRICTFCNMQRTGSLPTERYAASIIAQIKELRNIPYIRSGQYSSIYFGGGTPTTLSAQDLVALLNALRDSLPIAPDAEISIETSISELTDEKLEALRAQGVNRLSIGVQTFADRGRQLLGRRHKGAYIEERLCSILSMGFSNTNLDLIYNYPGQTDEELLGDIRRVQSLDVAGLSYYSLIINEGSLLSRKLDTTDRAYTQNLLERDYDCWSMMYDALCGNDFRLLELTKLVRPQRDTYRYITIRHNNGDTLPLGAGAGGRLGNLSLYSPGNIAAFEQMLSLPLESKYQGRRLSPLYNYAYRQIGKLQLGWLSCEEHSDFPRAAELYGLMRSFLLERELATEVEGRLVLNREGIFWGNNIASHCASLIAELATK